ncbi:hypothetical protein [Gryllotalpicola kribbensis]
MNENQTPLGPTDAQISRMKANIHQAIAADQAAVRRRRGWTIGGTLGLLVVLAGGTSVAMAAGVLKAPQWLAAAPAPAPTATHEQENATAPTPSPTLTLTPTSTPAPAAFDLPCSEQFDPTVLASFAPGLTLQPLAPLSYGVNPPTGSSVTAASIAPGENVAPPALISNIAAAESGYYSCRWHGEATQSIWGIQLAVLPDAASAFQEAKAQSVSSADYTHLASTSIGDDSFTRCAHTDALSGCELDVLSDGIWFTVRASSTAGHEPEPAAYADGLAALARSVIARVTAQGTPPQAVSAPASRWTGMTDCAAFTRALSAHIATPAYTFDAGTDGTDAYLPGFGYATKQSGAFSCYSGNADAPTVVVVPGAGSWAWDVPLASEDAVSAPVTITQLSTAGVPGLDAARYACMGNVGCWADAVIDGAMVTVIQPMGNSSVGATTALAELEAIAESTRR